MLMEKLWIVHQYFRLVKRSSQHRAYMDTFFFMWSFLAPFGFIKLTLMIHLLWNCHCQFQKNNLLDNNLKRLIYRSIKIRSVHLQQAMIYSHLKMVQKWSSQNLCTKSYFIPKMINLYCIMKSFM